MSRGFVKEGDQEEIPIVAPRADLPNGITNFVTEVGMNELLLEEQKVKNEMEYLDISNEVEKRIAINHINSKLQLLQYRIATAKIIDLQTQPLHEVRFGAFVTLEIGNETKHCRYQIVGVDEADITKRKISFISPIAKILMEKKVGEKAILKLAKEDRIFKIIKISY